MMLIYDMEEQSGSQGKGISKPKNSLSKTESANVIKQSRVIDSMNPGQVCVIFKSLAQISMNVKEKYVFEKQQQRILSGNPSQSA